MSNNAHWTRKILMAAAALVLIASALTASLPAAHAQGGLPVVSPLVAGSNFNSSFNGTHTGWSPVLGIWKQSSKAYWTAGTALDMFNSAKHAGTYRNFVYRVRLKYATSGSQNFHGIMFRGVPTPYEPVSGRWHSGYFLELNTNMYALHRYDNGVLTTIVPWTVSGAIIPGANWNVLKIVAYGPLFWIYINGVLQEAKADWTYANGYVGVIMQRYSLDTGTKLSVDWAKLDKIVGDPGLMPALTPGTSAAPLQGGDGWSLP